MHRMKNRLSGAVVEGIGNLFVVVFLKSAGESGAQQSAQNVKRERLMMGDIAST